jgi:hypothetical protein
MRDLARDWASWTSVERVAVALGAVMSLTIVMLGLAQG